MAHLSWLERTWKRLSVNRISRMHLHFDAILPELAPGSEKERQEVAYFRAKFMKYLKRSRILYKVRLGIYIAIYASLVANFLTFLIGIELTSDLFEWWTAIVTGISGALIVLILWITSRINLNVELMNESLTHLIAMYHANGKRDTKKTLRRLEKAL